MEQNQSNQMPEANLRDILNILFKHKKKISVCFIVVMIIVALGIAMSQRVFESEAKLFVNLGRKSMVMDSANDFQERVHVSQSMENQINSEIEIIKSLELMQRVVSALGVESFDEASGKYKSDRDSFSGVLRRTFKDILAFPKNAIADFISTPEEGERTNDPSERIASGIKNNLSVSVVKDSNIIRISFESYNPHLSRDVIHELIKAYLEKHRELLGSPKSHEFFSRESANFEMQLEAAENRLKEFKNRINVGSLDDQRHILSQQIGNLQQKLKETQSSIAILNSLEESTNENTAQSTTFLVPEESVGFQSPAMNEMRNKIYELKLKEQELLSVYKDTSVPVTEVRRQIQKVQALFLKAKQSTLDALEAQAVSLKNQITNANEELKKLNEAEFKLAQLEREKQLLEKKYQTYAHSLEQTRIDKALEMEEISNIKIAQAPIVPIEPIKPRKKIFLIMGFVIALFSSFGLAFFVEYFDTSIQKPEQIEDALDIPVLGSIEEMKK